MRTLITVLLMISAALGQSVSGGRSVSGGVVVLAKGASGGGGGTSNSFTHVGTNEACIHNDATTQTSCSKAVASNAGALIYTGFITNDATGTLSCSDNVNGAWTPDDTKLAGTGSANGYQWQGFSKILTTTGSINVTCSTTNAVTFHAFQTMQFTATGTITKDGTGVNQQVQSSAGTPSTATLTGLTTSYNNAVIIETCLYVDSACSAIDPGFTLADGGFNSATSGRLGYKLTSTAGAQTATFTTDNPSLQVGGAITAFKAQ